MTSLQKSTFDKSARRILFLSADKLAVYHWNKGKLGSSYLFDVSDNGQDYFKRYLQETANTPFYLLVDVLEEEFRQDTIPHVYGPDRKTLIERKKSRLFRDTPYFHTVFQGRLEEGRRDDIVLFMGLTKPEILKPWLALLDEQKVPLAGIYSLPQITKDILDLLPDPADHMLVVSMQSISGLRQTFFHKKQLKISRLVNLPRYGTASYAIEVRDEVEKIHRYLNGMHLTPVDKPLDIYILANKDLLTEIEALGPNAALIKYHFIDLESLAKNSGVEMEVTTPFCDRFIAHQLLKNRPENIYASSSETRYFQMKKIRKTMLAASMFLIMGSIIWGGLNFMGGMLYKQQAKAAVKKTNFYSARYQIAREKLPQTIVNPSELELVVNIVKQLEEYKATPFDMLKLLSYGMDRYPTVEIDQIEWAASTNPNFEFAGFKQSVTDQNILGVSDVDNEKSYKYYQIAVVKGHLNSFNGNYRLALDTINQFTSSFSELPAVHDASVMSLPLDIGSDASLQGSATAISRETGFSMRVVLGMIHGS